MKKNDKKEKIGEDNKTAIAILSIAIVAVLGLIFLTAWLSKEDIEKELDKKDEPTKVELKDKDLSNATSTKDSDVEKLSSKVYVVKYLDVEGEQLGKTQRLTSIDDRVNEKAPKIDGKRFAEWVQKYDENEDIYYFIASYRDNVEVVTEETKVTYSKTASHTSTVTPVEDSESDKPTYDVEIEGEVPEVEEIPEDISISEEYQRILVLRFYAPEDVTKEQIENMKVTVHATNSDEVINEDQYSFNGEDSSKTGRELLDSTDEEYENGIFYFDYYQETDTQTNTTVEVYWGNDPDANETTEPKDEYVEVYNIKLDNVETPVEEVEEETEEKPTEEPISDQPVEDQGQE